MKNRFSKLVAFALVLTQCAHIVAKDVKNPNTEQRFHKHVSKYPFVVALFYEDKREPQTDNLENMFESLADAPRYERAGVRFVQVNVLRRGVSNLPSKYGVSALPAIITFESGLVARTSAGATAQLVGFTTRSRLQAFIDDTIGDKISDALERQEEIMKQREREARERDYYRPRPSVYFGAGYPYYGYGYPYYGYPYWRRPYYGGIGFGFGFGGWGRRGWRRRRW